MARNPLTADTKPESFAEGVAKRQAILRGSEYLGSTLTRTGLGMIAYGSPRIPVKASSALMPKSTIGRSQRKLIPADKSPAPTRSNRWKGYEQDVRSKSGTSKPSTRTRMRAPNMVRSGRGLVLTGGFIPVLGHAYVAHSVIFPEYDVIDDVRGRPQRTVDQSLAIGNAGSNAWDSLSPTTQFVAKTAIWALLS